MHMKVFFFFVLCFSSYKYGNATGFDEAGLIPDVIDTIPPSILSVTYPNDEAVDLGNELTPTEVINIPTVEWDADPQSYYTLAMVDPDAPSREVPTYREIEHWLVVNILGSDISTGQIIAEYTGSKPPEGSGLHRYATFVYKQPNEIHFEETGNGPISSEQRRSFSIRNFAHKYALGEPIAGNFFEAQFERVV